MKKVTVKHNQTLYDIAVSEYGTCEAISELLVNNPELSNDSQAKVAMGIDVANDQDFYFDLPLNPGSVVLIDTDSRTLRKNILREIAKEVTTFDLINYGTDN